MNQEDYHPNLDGPAEPIGLSMQNDCVAQREMPKYKCHKTVHALKISAVMLDVDEAKSANRKTDGSAMIYPEDQGYAPFRVNEEYVRKHKPEAGGYYVVYDDGYKSFSPAKAFEDGYTRI